jgi:hypothetical protein
MANLPISRLIRVGIILQALASQAQDLSTLLELTSSTVIDTAERIRTYSSLDEVAADFGTGGAEYAAAVLWFQQAPQPTQFRIGRWAKTASAGKLVGGTMSTAQQAIANFTAITTPGFYIQIDGIQHSVAPASFASVTNLNGVASLIQSALPGGCTCVFNATYSRFEITSATTGTSSIVSYAKPPTATGQIFFGSNPSNNDTITLNGTVVTFKTSGATGNQVNIAGTLSGTLNNLLNFLNGSSDTQIIKFKYLVYGGNTLGVSAATPGTGGNSLTIAGSVATVDHSPLQRGGDTDISGLINIIYNFTSGVYVSPGIGAETALEAVALFDLNFGQTWYAITIPEASDSDHLAVASFIDATNNKHIYGVSTTEAGVLSAVSTTDIAYLLAQASHPKTVIQYSSSNSYSVCSLLGRALTVDYNGNNTVITLMYKQEPGIIAENLNSNQLSVLESKNCNVFVTYNNNTAIIEPGKVSSGDFLDTITGTDWLAIDVQSAVYNLLYGSPTKIPQTDAGTHIIVTTIEAVLSQGIANGLGAPGVWNSNGFGSLKQGDFLAKGFYVYAPSVNLQSQADRAARKSVPIQVAFKLAGAVHTVDISITIQR